MPPVVAFAGSKSEVVGALCESRIGIVLTQKDAVFGTRGKHSVRLINPLSDQIVDKHTDICLVALQRERAFACAEQCGVDASDESLSGSFFVASGAVDLSGEEQTAHELRLQRVEQLCGVEEVVFYGISRAVDPDVSQCRNELQSLYLHLHRH